MLKQYIAPLAKLFLVPIFLWVISQHISDKYDVNLLKIDMLLIFPAIIINQIALSLFAIRMQVILGVFGIKISQLQSLRIHLQSVFYFFVLPMTVGLEAARFAKVKSIVGEEATAVALGSALLIDRLIGAFAALFLATIILPFMDFKLLAQWGMVSSIAVFVGGSALIYLVTLHRRVRLYIHEIVGLLRSERRGVWIAIIASIFTHLFFSFGVYLAAMGAHIQITYLQTLFVISSAMLFVVFPVSFAGVSPVEAAGLGALLGLGVPMEHAVVFVFISYLAKLIAAFEGGGWEIYEGGESLSRHMLRGQKENV